MVDKTLINGITTNNISTLDRGLQYGDGVFETIAVQNNSLLCKEEHIERLILGCERLNIPFTETKLLNKEINSLCDSVEHGVIKIIITRGQGGRGYALPDSATPNRIIFLYPFPQHPKENSTEGINARICDYNYSHNPVLAGIKHLNRLEQVLARSEWTDNSIAEGIVLDLDDNVIEGTMSNLFCVIDNILYTPNLNKCGVDGIIRNKVISLASELNIDVEIKNISIETLYKANELFVCNSVIGIWPIKKLNDHSFNVGPVTNKIKQSLQNNNYISSL